MSDGFPLLTTKKLHWKSIVGELLWFLKGSTDIRHLWKDNISIWDGDWFKKYKNTFK
jgi:thymidylate synthase